MLLKNYFQTLSDVLENTEATDSKGMVKTPEEAFHWHQHHLQRIQKSPTNKQIFIGNGGSAGICSHLAIDYSKNGGVRSIAFNDAAALTCLSNDIGYENVFAAQIYLYACTGDLVVLISSSGQSPNILKAAKAALSMGCHVLTLSGFSPQNPLRTLGTMNLYVPSTEYGFVEVSHLALCHAALDLNSGWMPSGVIQYPASQHLLKKVNSL